MLVVVIIVSFESGNELDSLVAHYAAHGVRVVVVENGERPSGGQNADIFLCGHGNIGYGAALNFGYRAARDEFGVIEWVMVANADATPSHALLQAVTSGELNAKADLFGFREGCGERWRGVIPSPASPFMIMLHGEKRAVRRLPDSRLYPVGALLLIRRRCFDELGGFDPRFFLYFEEVDLVERARLLGHHVAFAPRNLTYTHAAHSATKTIAQKAAYELGRSAAIYVGAQKGAGLGMWIVGEFLRLFALYLRANIVRDTAAAMSTRATLRGLYEGLVRPRHADERSREMLGRPRGMVNAQLLARPHRTQVGQRRIATLAVFEDPRSPRSGADLRNWSTLTSLSTDFDVTCVVASGRLMGSDSDGGVRYVAGARRGVFATMINALLTRRQWMTARYDTSRTRKELRAACAQSEVVIASMINMGTIIESKCRARDGRPVILWDTQNYDPELWSTEARDAKGLRKALSSREGRMAVRAATSLATHVDAVIACSQRDFDMWGAFLGSNSHLYLAPNGADLAAWQPVASVRGTEGVFASFGSLGQRMTADGLVDFLERGWPELKRARPDASLLIAGRDPQQRLLRSASRSENVTIIADPNDLAGLISAAELLLFPQLRGYGSKIKMYEALATGRPIVASTAAVIGIPEEFLRRVTVVDNDDWASAVERALKTWTGAPPAGELDKLGWWEQQRIMRDIYSELLALVPNGPTVNETYREP